MFDLKAYPWFNANTSLPNDDILNQTKLKSIFDEISVKPWLAYQKDVIAQYYLQEVIKTGKDNISFNIEETYDKTIKVCERSNAFNKIKATTIKNDTAKFTMSSLFVIMAGTLVIFFIRAVITQTFLFNFSIDAIVGAVAIVVFALNMKSKFGVIKRYSNPKDYLLLDICSIVVCLLLKFALPPFIDISVLALFGTYLLEKKRLDKVMN